MAALLRRLNQALVRIELGITRKHCDFHDMPSSLGGLPSNHLLPLLTRKPRFNARRPIKTGNAIVARFASVIWACQVNGPSRAVVPMT